jgi:hypothetical protein
MDTGGRRGRRRRGEPGRGGGRETRLGEQRVVAETGVPIPAVGVEDPECRPPAGRTDPAPVDDDLGRLTDDIPAQSDPGAPGQLQPDPGPLPDRGGHRANEPRRLQDEEADPGPSCQRGEPAEPFSEACRALRPGRQVQDEEVHRPTGEERAGDRETLVRARRGEDHQPFRLDPAGHGLDRIERVREIQPGDDRPARLRLRREAERDRGPPAREVPAQREAHPAREAARPEDGVQVREAGGEDACPIRAWHGGRGWHGGARRGHGCRHRRGCHRERSHDDRRPATGGLPEGARRGRSPARSQGREGRRHVRGKGRHEPSIEHLFE